MNEKDISQANDPDLRTAIVALKRAAEMARAIAIQTGTDLVISDAGRLTHIPTADLRRKQPKNTNHE